MVYGRSVNVMVLRHRHSANLKVWPTNWQVGAEMLTHLKRENSNSNCHHLRFCRRWKSYLQFRPGTPATFQHALKLLESFRTATLFGRLASTNLSSSGGMHPSLSLLNTCTICKNYRPRDDGTLPRSIWGHVWVTAPWRPPCNWSPRPPPESFVASPGS